MKKSIVISLLTFTTLVGTAICSFASTGIVTADTLRLRSDASTDASIVALLSMDAKVEILEKKDGWYKVKVGDKIGFVSADYIKVEEETNNPTETKVEEEKVDTNEKTAENKVMVKELPAETKVYITPVINSIVTDTITEKVKIDVKSEVNGWSYITAGNIKGWVRTDSIVEREASETEIINTSSLKTGYISASSVNFREEANTSSNVISTLIRNTEVKIVEKVNGWAKILYNDKLGYVSAQYVSDQKVQITSRSSTTKATTKKQEYVEEPAVSQGSATGSEIVAFARKFLGYKYVYGGSTPNGFDCSGYTQYVYKHFGYSLNRTAADQSKNGKAVSQSELQEGDVICFANSSGSKKIGHVGLYIGDGKFIHAANSRKGVIISNVTGAGFYFVCARRII